MEEEWVDSEKMMLMKSIMCLEQRLAATLLSSMAAATNVTRSLDRLPRLRLVEREGASSSVTCTCQAYALRSHGHGSTFTVNIAGIIWTVPSAFHSKQSLLKTSPLPARRLCSCYGDCEYSRV